MTQGTLQCWWIRHLPIEEAGRYTGQSDVPAIIPAHAAQLAMPLPGEDAIWFAAPLLRAIDTAHWLMASYPANTGPLQRAPQLMEQHFGAWEGKPYDEVWTPAQQAHDWSHPEAVKPEGGESFCDVCARVDSWLELQLAGAAQRPLIIVAHAGSIRAALRHALGITPAQALSFGIDYGSITHIVYSAGQPIASVNYVNR